jgi:uncharacterized membrane protein
VTLSHLRRRATLVLVIGFAVALVALSPSAAHAETVAPTPGATISFAPTWVQLLSLVVTVVLPVLVGLVTTRETNPGRKALLLAALAAVTGLGTELLGALSTGTPYDLAAGLYVVLQSFVIAVALHYGLLKPTGISSRLAGAGHTAPEHRA